MRIVKRKDGAVLILFVCMLAGGCGRSIRVTETNAICEKAVNVHLIGITRSERDRWERKSMTDYWEPGDMLRSDAKGYTKELRFSRDSCTFEILRTDPYQKIWKQRNAEYLLILANLPPTFDDSDDNADPRRLRVPAPYSKRWKGKLIKIKIDRSVMTCLTRYKEEK